MSIQPRNSFEQWVLKYYRAKEDDPFARHLLELDVDGDYKEPKIQMARDAWNEGFNAANNTRTRELYPR